MASYDGAMASAYRGRATDVIYLDFCKAFDMVPHHILLFDGLGIGWLDTAKGLLSMGLCPDGGQSQVVTPRVGLGTGELQHLQMKNPLRAALQRRTWGSWWMRGWT